MGNSEYFRPPLFTRVFLSKSPWTHIEPVAQSLLKQCEQPAGSSCFQGLRNASEEEHES